MHHFGKMARSRSAHIAIPLFHTEVAQQGLDTVISRFFAILNPIFPNPIIPAFITLISY